MCYTALLGDYQLFSVFVFPLIRLSAIERRLQLCTIAGIIIVRRLDENRAVSLWVSDTDVFLGDPELTLWDYC